MKKIAYILSFIFLTFVSGPTVITLIDDSVDISFAFTVNEEENSSKNLESFESLVEGTYSNHESIEFLKAHLVQGYSYNKDNYLVYLEVVSPPPRNI